MRKTILTLAVMILACVTVGIQAQAQNKTTGKVNAFVSILPMASFVQRVGGPHVQVTVLVQAGQDPHTFDPSPQLMAKLAQAQLLFKMGFPFETALMRKIGSTFKNLEVVDLQKGISLRPMAGHEVEAEHDGHGHHEEQTEGHKHVHHAGEMDPHSWLDPQRAKVQAATIADALMRVDPTHGAQYETNLKGLQKDLDAIDVQLKKALSPLQGKSFFVFHPAYGYFADRYGLKQVPVEAQGKEPSAKQLARLIDRAKRQNVKVVFVEPQFSKKTAQAIASAIGGAVVPLDPLAPDYLKNLKAMATELEAALSRQR